MNFVFKTLKNRSSGSRTSVDKFNPKMHKPFLLLSLGVWFQLQTYLESWRNS